MPVPVSKRQFRFLGAVRSGRARAGTTLTPSQAKGGMDEFKQQGKSYASLPETKRKARRAIAAVRAAYGRSA